MAGFEGEGRRWGASRSRRRHGTDCVLEPRQEGGSADTPPSAPRGPFGTRDPWDCKSKLCVWWFVTVTLGHGYRVWYRWWGAAVTST